MKLITTYATIILLGIFTVSEIYASKQCPDSLPGSHQGRRLCVDKKTKKIIGDICVDCPIQSKSQFDLDLLCSKAYPDAGKCPAPCSPDFLESCKRACNIPSEKIKCEKTCEEQFHTCKLPCTTQRGSPPEGDC